MKPRTGCIQPLALLAVTALLLPRLTAAEPLPPHWSRSFGDGAEDRAGSVVVDDEGNIYVTGWFRGSIDFGGGQLISGGTRDIYLAKLDSDGNHLWSRRFGDTDHQIAVALAVNSLGQPVIAGSFMGSVDFGLGNHVSAGGWDLFVAKFTENGVPLWTRSYGDAQDQLAAGVGVGSGGAVCVTGFYQGSVDFGGGALTSAGGYDVFLFRLDSSSGFHMWSKRFGDAEDQVATDLDSHPQGRIAITGFARGTVDFGGGPLTSAGGNDMVVAMFEPWGDHRWSRMHGDASADNGYAVAIDGLTQDVVCTGFFGGSIDLGGGAFSSVGGLDIYLAKYSQDGAHVWSRRLGGNAADTARDVAIRYWGEIALTGYFEGTADFGGGPLASAGQTDLFLAVYDADGDHMDSQRAGDANLQEGEDLFFTPGGEVLALGHFEGTIDLGEGPLTSAGDLDVYLAKLGPIPSTVASPPGAETFRLRVHPNPLVDRAMIRYTLPRRGAAVVRIFDVEGRLIETLVDAVQEPGDHAVRWEAARPSGRNGPAGVRFVRLDLDGRAASFKVVHLR